MSIPLLVWSYYFFYQTLQRQARSWLAGLFLGLAIQGEIFLLYLIPFYYLWLYLSKHQFKNWWQLHLGLVLGLAPLLVAELKFRFIASQTFIKVFLLDNFSNPLQVQTALLSYLDHLGMVVKHTVFGWSYPIAFAVLIVLIGFVLTKYHQAKRKTRLSLLFVLTLLFSHSILFTFHFPNKVFLDLPVAVPLIIITAYVLVNLWSTKKLLASCCLMLIIGSNLHQLYLNTQRQTPFELTNFIQNGMLFSQKLEIVQAMYHLAGTDQPFSLSVLGTPYGVRTVWASVLEQYTRRHQLPMPSWFGYVAHGYPGEQLLVPQDHPHDQHILLIEANQDLIDQYTRLQYLAHQDKVTTLVAEQELYGYKIQLRKPIKIINKNN
ncbi:MAG: hypothetical protein GF390_00330 [Candidatus Pacebacteria bacterium]|nr:hypothetical protein [Candidatus Paceibacterota bacterium]